MRSLALLLMILVTSVGFAIDHSGSNRDPAGKPTSQSTISAQATNDSTRQTVFSDRPATRSVEPSRHSPKRPIPEPQVMRIDQLVQYCVMPEGLVSFNGQGLLVLKERDLAIQHGQKVFILNRLSSSNQQATYRLPKADNLQANQQYKVIVLHSNKQTQQTDLNLRICPETIATSVDNMAFELGEIVLLTAIEQQQKVEQQLQQFGYQIRDVEQLQSLKKVIFTLQVEQNQIEQILIQLRQRFPETVIDVNSHLSPMQQVVSKPRLYAKQQLAWHGDKACNRQYSHLKIGLIDGSVDTNHLALSQQTIISQNFIGPKQQKESEHGTAVASILIADKAEWGLQGLLNGSTLYSAEVLRKQNTNTLATMTSIVKAMDWLLSKQVRLINVSLAGSRENRVMTAVFEQAIKQGSIVFAAAGNDGQNAVSKSYPAAINGVITVTAVDAAKRVYKKANQGDYIDFAAPGVDIWTADNMAIAKYRSGTSYAVPYAVGIAALYLSYNPSIARDVIYQTMKSAAIDLGGQGHDSVFGWGMLKTPKISCKQ